MFTRAAALLLVGSLSAPAAAEQFLALDRGEVDDARYPEVAVDLRVRWEKGVREEPGDVELYAGCSVSVKEGGKPLDKPSLQFVREGSAVWDRVRLHFRSRRAERSPHLIQVRLECGGAHNGSDGEPIPLFGVPTNAHIVIAGGGRSRPAATTALNKMEQRLPAHGHFPRVDHSDFVVGLKPGFHIVTAAVADDPGVAQLLVEDIERRGGKAYTKPVWVPKPPRLRLLELSLLGDRDGDKKRPFDGGVELQQVDPRSKKTHALSTGRTGDGGAVHLPFVPRGHERVVTLVLSPGQDYECNALRFTLPEDARRVKLGVQATQCFMLGD